MKASCRSCRYFAKRFRKSFCAYLYKPVNHRTAAKRCWYYEPKHTKGPK